MSPIFELKLAPPTVELNPGTERPVDRNFLLDIAPDRESLIMGTEDIIKVRDALALKVSDEEYDSGNHWLTKRDICTRIKLRNVPKRISALGWSGSPSNTARDIRTLLDSLPPSATASTASLTTTNTNTIINLVPITEPPPANSNSNTISNVTLNTSAPNINKPLPSQPAALPHRLTTDQVLISPRPLGPTHTLLLYSNAPTSEGMYSEVVEVPVCDLLVAVHCPNLRLGGGAYGSDCESFSDSRSVLGSTAGSGSASGCGDVELTVRIPHRQDSSGNLPRMLLRVHDVATFPALVVYMHTRDRSRLVKEVVGETVWSAMKLFHGKNDLPLFSPSILADFTNTNRNGKNASSVALALALSNLPYTELASTGASLLALMQNIEDVGLKERALTSDIEKLVRACIGALNGKSRLLGADDGEKVLEDLKRERTKMIEKASVEEEGNAGDDGDDEVRGECCPRWKLNLSCGFSGLGPGWGWKLVPCIH